MRFTSRSDRQSTRTYIVSVRVFGHMHDVMVEVRRGRVIDVLGPAPSPSVSNRVSAEAEYVARERMSRLLRSGNVVDNPNANRGIRVIA